MSRRSDKKVAREAFVADLEAKAEARLFPDGREAHIKGVVAERRAAGIAALRGMHDIVGQDIAAQLAEARAAHPDRDLSEPEGLATDLLAAYERKVNALEAEGLGTTAMSEVVQLPAPQPDNPNLKV